MTCTIAIHKRLRKHIKAQIITMMGKNMLTKIQEFFTKMTIQTQTTTRMNMQTASTPDDLSASTISLPE